MRVEYSPENAHDFLAIHVSAEESALLAESWPLSSVVVDEEFSLGVTIKPLSEYEGEDRDDREEALLAERPLAEDTSSGGEANLDIYIPDEWLPKNYFTRIPIPVKQARTNINAGDLPPKGVMLIFERDEEEHTYALFPRP